MLKRAGRNQAGRFGLGSHMVGALFRAKLPPSPNEYARQLGATLVTGAPSRPADAGTINVSVSVSTSKVGSTSVEHSHHGPNGRGTCFDGVSRKSVGRPVMRDTSDRDGVALSDRNGAMRPAGRAKAVPAGCHAVRGANRPMCDKTISHDRNTAGIGASAAVRGGLTGSTSTWAPRAVLCAGITP
jgi:hypothetical protein